MSTTTDTYTDIPGISIQVSREVVVASIQVDLDEDVVDRFREDLLRRIHQTGSRGVIFDVSGLETLDSSEFAALRRIISMSAIMGAQSVLVGLRPGVVSALIEMDTDVDGLVTALDLDAAYDLLEPQPEPDSAGDNDAAETTEAEHWQPPAPVPNPADEQ